MHVIAPITVTDAVLTASSLGETDHAAWSSATTYAVGDRVIVVSTTLSKSTGEAWAAGDAIYWNRLTSLATTTVIAGQMIGRAASVAAAGTATGSVAVHGIYESLVGTNLNHNPVTDAAAETPAWWAKVGATTKWKAFDGSISNPATGTGPITYDLLLPSLVTGLAFFGLNASSVRVSVASGSLSPGTVIDAETVVTDGGVLTYDETRNLSSGSDIVDWFSFFSWEPSFETEALFTGLPGYAGSTLIITVEGSEVGQIVPGKVITLGTPLPGTEVGFTDFSRKERDEFGAAVIVQRDYADTVDFRFAVPFSDLRRVKREIVALRATPAVWFAGADITHLGATIYGFPTDGLRVPLEAAGVHFATLTIEGLT